MQKQDEQPKIEIKYKTHIMAYIDTYYKNITKKIYLNNITRRIVVSMRLVGFLDNLTQCNAKMFLN